MFMVKKNSSEISISISITAEAKEIIDRLSSKTDIPQKRLLSKIYMWFAALPKAAQKAVLWPEETSEDIDATLFAIEFLKSRRAEVLAAEIASRGAKKVVSQAAKSLGQQSNPTEPAGQSPHHKSAS